MRLRVLHVIPALGQGGAERLLADLVSRMEDIEHHVLVMIREPPFFNLGNATCSQLGLHRGHASLRALRHARMVQRETAPDLVHAWLYHGNLLSTLMHRP